MARVEGMKPLLETLVAIPSVNPPGDERAICGWIGSWLASFGIPSREIAFAPGRPSLVAEIPGREAGALLLSGHLDTVSPAAGWTGDPFTPRWEGTRLYGLGATDMKGGAAMVLEAFRAVAERAGKGKSPRHTLRLLLSADEEDAYQGASAMAREGLTRDALFTLVAEPTGGRVLAGERGEFWLRVHFTGKEAHGSTPEEGINAVMACARFLWEVQSRITVIPPVPFLGPATLCVGRMHGGRQVNIVPDRADAELDIRLGSQEVKAEVESCLEEVGARVAMPGRFSWETISYKRPMRAVFNDPFLQALGEAAREHTEAFPEFGVASFCTDLPSLFPDEDPAFAIFGPGDIAQAHQPEEFIELTSLERSADVLERFLAVALG